MIDDQEKPPPPDPTPERPDPGLPVEEGDNEPQPHRPNPGRQETHGQGSENFETR